MNPDTVPDLEVSASRLNALAENIRVLLIDDDEDSFIITKNDLSFVEGANVELEWVATFDAGLEAMRQGKYDAYLVDYLLGERNGLDLMHRPRPKAASRPSSS